MVNTEKFRMRKYSKQKAANMRGVKDKQKADKQWQWE